MNAYRRQPTNDAADLAKFTFKFWVYFLLTWGGFFSIYEKQPFVLKLFNFSLDNAGRMQYQIKLLFIVENYIPDPQC